MKEELKTATARLDDYVRGYPEDAPAEDCESYEEALFARALAAAAPELTFRAELAATLREMDARGALEIWLTARDVERLRRSGRNIVFYELDAANPVPPEFTPDSELFIARVPLDLTGVRTLDVEILSLDGRVLKRMPDVHFDASDGAIYACCEAELARTAASSVGTRTRFWATDASGSSRLLFEVPLF
jgi:hypothetical protein